MIFFLFFKFDFVHFFKCEKQNLYFLFHPISMRTEVQWVQWCAVCVWLYEPGECSIYLHMMTFYCSAAKILNNKINTFIHLQIHRQRIFHLAAWLDWTRDAATNEYFFSKNDQTQLECMKKNIEALFLVNILPWNEMLNISNV